MPTPTHEQFIETLRSSRSAQMISAEVLAELETSFSDATDEQLNQAMNLIQSNNEEHIKIDEATAKERQKVAAQMKIQVQKVKKVRLKNEEKTERASADHEAKKLLDEARSLR